VSGALAEIGCAPDLILHDGGVDMAFFEFRLHPERGIACDEPGPGIAECVIAG
jgi:hypothetical protein